MNNICGSCGGFVGDFIYSGFGARICNCATVSGSVRATRAIYQELIEQGKIAGWNECFMWLLENGDTETARKLHEHMKTMRNNEEAIQNKKEE
jgi:hypothetical protein